jgi:hypothetical protein
VIELELLERGFPPETPRGIAEMRGRLRALHDSLPPVALSVPQPFLILTPLGMTRREEIYRWLLSRGYSILQRTPIPDWSTASTYLYVRTLEEERLRVAAAFERLWRSAFPSMQAEWWQLESIAALERLGKEKTELRACMGTLLFRLHVPDLSLRSPGQAVRLQVVHVPDLIHLPLEAAILEALKENWTAGVS